MEDFNKYVNDHQARVDLNDFNIKNSESEILKCCAKKKLNENKLLRIKNEYKTHSSNNKIIIIITRNWDRK